jgi:protein ImuB
VFRVAPVESDLPERSLHRLPALAPPQGATWPRGLARPSVLLDPPEPVAALALAPDYPPAFFEWRRVRHRVRSADGPERVFGEWWKAQDEVSTVRDYYRVEDEHGRQFWLFRDGPAGQGGRWWLHGFFG